MVNFGQKLLDAKYEPWSSYYIDYEQLKDRLEQQRASIRNAAVVTSGDQQQPRSTSSSFSSSSSLSSSLSTSSSSSSGFLSCLYLQTEKVSFFVLQEQGKITKELADCRRHQLIMAHPHREGGGGVGMLLDDRSILLLEERYVKVGSWLLQLVKFIDWNLTGFRKILKKHDKITQTKLSTYYFALQQTPTDSNTKKTTMTTTTTATTTTTTTTTPSSVWNIQRFFSFFFFQRETSTMDHAYMGNRLLQPLLQYDTISALAAAYQAGIDELRFRRYLYNKQLEPRMTRSATAPTLSLREKSYDEEYQSTNRDNNNSNNTIVPQFTTSPISVSDLRTLAMEQQQHSKKTTPEQVLLQIYAAKGRLRHTNEFIKLLEFVSLVEDDDDSQNAQQETLDEFVVEPTNRPSKFSNLLNLLSTFLYMTNYYIAAPTSATYASKVGSSSSVASIIIGMTAMAALVSTLLYSWWTSYSYKAPIVFSSVCSLVGNLLYGAGLPCHSLEVVMLGRLLTGFGSCRSINRRYIADSYSRSDRTAASAAFVTASAVGMATGPALAALLHELTRNSTSVYWQPENAPGWFMCIVYAMFLVCLIWKFEDPPRSHREEYTHRKMEGVSNEGVVDEKMPLMSGNGANGSGDEENGGTTCASHKDDDHNKESLCSIPVLLTLIVYTVLKMVLEAVVSSESNLTDYYFGWTGSIRGVHLASLALLVLPVNFCISFLSRKYFDRELIIGLLILMFGGCIIVFQYQSKTEEYSLAQYLIGTALLFACATALEAPNMSLLSKVIPREWSKGIINVGLLATESGTLGRVIGDIILAGMASRGIEKMLNHAFGAFAATIVSSIVLCFVFYDELEPIEQED